MFQNDEIQVDAAEVDNLTDEIRDTVLVFSRHKDRLGAAHYDASEG